MELTKRAIQIEKGYAIQLEIIRIIKTELMFEFL